MFSLALAKVSITRGLGYIVRCFTGLYHLGTAPIYVLRILLQRKVVSFCRNPEGHRGQIIDISVLNTHIQCPSSKMETTGPFLRALTGQWLTSLDLKDAYFHIPIYPPHRRYLRFCHEGVWQVRALPFGLNTTPNVVHKGHDSGCVLLKHTHTGPAYMSISCRLSWSRGKALE